VGSHFGEGMSIFVLGLVPSEVDIDPLGPKILG